MSNYEKELQAEIERVTLRGSPDKKTIQKLASIIWRLEQRLAVLENEVVVDEKPARLETPVEVPTPTVKDTASAVKPAKGRGRPAKEK
jgi:hypothetical protein